MLCYKLIEIAYYKWVFWSLGSVFLFEFVNSNKVFFVSSWACRRIVSRDGLAKTGVATASLIGRLERMLSYCLTPVTSGDELPSRDLPDRSANRNRRATFVQKKPIANRKFRMGINLPKNFPMEKTVFHRI